MHKLKRCKPKRPDSGPDPFAADRFGPQGPVSVVLHFEQDVQPAIISGKAGMIDEYYKRRSPDPGKNAQGNLCRECGKRITAGVLRVKQIAFPSLTKHLATKSDA